MSYSAGFCNNMKTLTFRAYSPADRTACLDLFDANCPEFFAPNERVDYEGFLDEAPSTYWVCVRGREILAAFGFVRHRERGRIQWIMVGREARGLGLGGRMMRRIQAEAGASGVRIIDIAASQKSASFFARYGAEPRQSIPEGWGPGLDRIDMELELTNFPA